MLGTEQQQQQNFPYIQVNFLYFNFIAILVYISNTVKYHF